MRATLAGALRRKLLAHGCTLRPTCPACLTQRDPQAFTRDGICGACEAERAAAYRAAEAHADLLSDGMPSVEPVNDTMVDDGFVWDDDA